MCVTTLSSIEIIMVKPYEVKVQKNATDKGGLTKLIVSVPFLYKWTKQVINEMKYTWCV